MILIKPLVKAHGSTRALGDMEETDLEELATANYTSTADMLWGKTPDCQLLGYPVDEDPRWDFGTIKLTL